MYDALQSAIYMEAMALATYEEAVKHRSKVEEEVSTSSKAKKGLTAAEEVKLLSRRRKLLAKSRIKLQANKP